VIRRRDEALATLLQDAARAAAFPPTPPLAEHARARIEAGPLPVAAIRLPRTRPPLLRPVLVTLAVLAVTVAVALSVSVTARRAVADLLGVVGIRVTFGDEPPSAPVPPGRIPLGEPVTRDAAGDLAGFRVLIPSAVEDEPAIYYERSIGDGGMVSVVYPRSAKTLAGVDLLVSQFSAALPADYVKKLSTLGSQITYTPVRSSEGYWISGEPHFFFYEERRDGIRQEAVRLAGNVLLWAEDGVTYRVEGAASLREALRIADSLR
jgi:hypothetical protein